MLSWVAQGIGMIGTALVMVSFQFRGRRLFLLQGFAAVAFAVNFALLGAYAGMLLNVLSAVRGGLLSMESKGWASHPFWFWFLQIAYVVCGVATWQAWFSLLPVIAMMVSTVTMWRKNGRQIRTMQLLVVSPCWMIYSALVFSVSGMVTELFNIVSIVISIVRFGWNGLNLPEPEPSRGPQR